MVEGPGAALLGDIDTFFGIQTGSASPNLGVNTARKRAVGGNTDGHG
jgi:hypothetical protein